MRAIYDATVIDSQDRFADVVRSSGEYAKSINHRLLYDGMCHERNWLHDMPTGYSALVRLRISPDPT